MSHPGDARKKSDAILEEGRCKVGRFCTRNNGFFGFFLFLCLFHFLHLEDWVAPHVPVIQVASPQDARKNGRCQWYSTSNANRSLFGQNCGDEFLGQKCEL